MTASTESATAALNGAGSVATQSLRPAPKDAAAAATGRRRWLGLVVIAMSQLMIVVDATIVNVALPAMTTTLSISPADRQWVVTVYTLTFGGLLLIGGRVADYLGLRRAFVIGLLGFGVASAIGGAAQNLVMLLLARGLQGAFGALLAPAALALLANTFHDPKERAKAFAIFGAVAGGGSAVGLILGGVLTEYASWRWTMFINIPIAMLTVAGAYALLDEHRGEHPGRLDMVGTVLATSGLLSLVYSFSEAQRHGWAKPLTLGLIGAGVVLLIAFVASQRVVANPVLPLRILADRTRAGANVAVAMASVALFGAFFFLTFFMQGVLRYSPVKTGVGFLAITVGIVISSGVVSTIGAKVRPRIIMGGGLLGAATGMALLLRIQVDSSYGPDLMPPLLLIGLSLGCVFVPAFNAATIGIAPRDASIASATINMVQQVGGSLGVALLATVAANRATEWFAGHGVDPTNLILGQVEGDRRASLWGAIILAVAAVLTAGLINIRRLDMSPHAEAMGAMAVEGPVVTEVAVAAMVEQSPASVLSSPVVTEVAVIEQSPAPVVSSQAASNGSAKLADVPVPPRRSEPGPNSGWAASGAPGARPLIGPTAPAHSNGHHPGPPAALERRDLAARGPAAPAGPAARATVRDTAGAPLVGAVWTVLDSVGRQLELGRTDASGSFCFGGSGRSEVVLVVRLDGYRPHASTVVLRPDLGEPVRVEVVLRAGLRVTGEVRSPTGEVITQARVWLEDDEGSIVARTRSDSLGRYEFLDVPAGSYKLSAVGYPPSGRDVEVSDGRDVETRLTLAHLD